MKVGDRVIVCSPERLFGEQWRVHANGTVGTLDKCDSDPESPHEKWFWVTFDNGYRNNYGETHLELDEFPTGMDSLEYDDILAGQEIYSKLEGKS